MQNILDKLASEVDKISDSDVEKAETAPTATGRQKNKPEVADNSTMGQLLDASPVNFPQTGATVTGRIIEVSSNEIYLDLAPFGTGIVLGKEIKDGMGTGRLKEGDEVSAIVIEPENEDGYIELSIREASHERAWDDIESKRDTQEKISTKILNANKGGLLVEVNGISGFLPVSQLSSKNYPRVEDGDKNKILAMLKKLIGQELSVRRIDADRESQKLIVSEKAAMSEKDREIISSLKVGDLITGEVSGVVDFGAFIKFKSPVKAENERPASARSPRFDNQVEAGENDESTRGGEKLEGLVHISELAWQLIEDPRTIIKVGDKVQAKIIGIDADKISLSIRALHKDPWSEVEKKYKVNDIVSGTVNKINPFGAFVYLDKDIHGLAHISEMSEAYPGKSMDELIKVGQDYSWKILSIEPKEHRMGLMLADKAHKNTEAKQKNTEIKKAEKAEKVAHPAKDENVKKEKKETKKEKAAKKEPTKKEKTVKSAKKAKK